MGFRAIICTGICAGTLAALAGCAGLRDAGPGAAGVVVRTPGAGGPRPVARPERLATDAVGTGTENGMEAVGTVAAGEASGYLGETVASLGLLDRPGFWLATPLVSREQPGIVERVGGGARAQVLLVPNGAAAGAGSQISLAAMQALGVSPAALVPLKIHARSR